MDSGVLLGTIVLTLCVDKIGRRRPLMFSALATGICMMVITILLRYRDLPVHGHAISMASIAFFAIVSTQFKPVALHSILHPSD